MIENPVQHSEPSVALCLGGMDPSGGAGLLRDVLTLSALGVHPMVISLAETIQNGLACTYIEAPSASPLLRLEALRPHLSGHWGVKVGLCAVDGDHLRSLVALLREMAPPVRIWDPIQAPSVGSRLHSDTGLRRLAGILLSDGEWVVCPNRLEAAALMGSQPGDSAVDPERLARPWLDLGARAVWLKGGHDEGTKGGSTQVEDLWITRDRVQSLGAGPRLSGERRGTGCTLASAWLGFRLRGMDEVSAALEAVRWLRGRWGMAFMPGGVGRPCFGPEPS